MGYDTGKCGLDGYKFGENEMPFFFSPQTFFLSFHVTSRFKNVWKILSTHFLFALINSKLSSEL